MMQLKHEKIMHNTLDIINLIIKQRWFKGTGDDYVSRIEFDDKTKRFKSLKNLEEQNRNLTNALIDCVVFPIKENYNDRYDRLFVKSIKCVLLLLANNLFSVKITGFRELFRELSRASLIARNQNIRGFVQTLICKLFDTINQRITLCNFFFKSTNPMNYFYTPVTRKLIEEEVKLTLVNVVDKIQISLENKKDFFITDLSKHYLDKIDISDLKLNLQDIQNELGFKAGLFGWCTICRKEANYYCKEKRVPICSYECKLKNLDNLDKFFKYVNFNKKEEKKEIVFKQNYIQIFEDLSKKCFQKQNEKEKIFYLEILLDMIKSPSTALRRDPLFIIFIKKDVLPFLTKTTFHTDYNILKTSLIIFLNLVFNFRKYLRYEIGIYIQEVFLQILESVNSKFIYKYYILQVLTTLIEEKSIPFELFLNYDCREGSFNICEQIIDLLVKISQGKYKKNVYSSMINELEEEKLRKEAREAIIHLITGCSLFLKEQQKMDEIKETKTSTKGMKKVLEKKKQIEIAFLKFNAGKKSGIRKLKELGVIKEGPENMADFLRNDKRCSHFMIGEIFGGEEDFNLKVLDLYLKKLDFKGISTLEALRFFLSLFEFPGEGQKVERILGMFAEKYSDDNENMTQDGAHLLSFLLMMLHTNVYSPQVKEKMILADFLSIGKNINNDDKPIPVEELTKYFHDIYQKPIAVHSLEKRKKDIQNTLSSSLKKKQELFEMESSKLLENYNSKMQTFEIKADFKFLEDPSVLQVFISTMWTNLLAFFSTSIANAEDQDELRALVDSTMTMIKLSDVFDMQNERDSFINLLVQFSGLEKTFNNLFDEKHLLLMQAILSIATKMGNHLNTGWKFVLNCIVSLNYYQIQADKIDPIKIQNQTLNNSEKNSLFVASYFTKDDLNKIFSDTDKLNEHSVLNFFSGLTDLALKEIESEGSRTHYILEQIVVVLNFNIYRNPLEWLRIWKLIDELYEKIIEKNSKSKSKILIFSIDILRQLVLCCFRNKYILQNKYQDKIFSVYTTICSNKKIDGFIVDYLLITFKSLLYKLKDDIKGGISQIISTLILCDLCSQSIQSQYVQQSNEISMEILTLISFIMENLDIFSNYLNNDFETILNVLSQLTKKKFLPVVIKSLDMQEDIFNLFWKQDNLKIKNLNYSKSVLGNFVKLTKNPEKIYFSNENIFFQNFILKTLENLIDFEVKTITEHYKEILNKIFEILNKTENYLLMDSWEMLQEKILSKLLLKLHNLYIENPKNIEDFKEIFLYCAKSNFALIFQNKIKPVQLLKVYFELLHSLSKFNNKMILDCLTLNLNDIILFTAQLEENNPWISEIWEEIIKYLNLLFCDLFPHELIDNEIWKEMEKLELPISFNNFTAKIFEFKEFTSYKCRFILNLIKLIQIILKKTELKQESIDSLFKIMENFIKSSREFNKFSLNRFILWKKGYFSDKDSLPSLYIFEINVLLAKFFYYKKNLDFDNEKIFEFIIEIYQDFFEKLTILDQSLEILEDKDKLIISELIFNNEFKKKDFEEKQTSVIFFFNLINDNINPFLLHLDLESFEFRPIFDSLIDVLIDYLSLSNINSFTKFKCVECVNCENCKLKNKRLKDTKPIKDFLKLIIRKKNK